MKEKRYFVALLTAMFIMAVVMPGRALAQQAKVIELTYGTPFAADFIYSKADQRWIAKIEKETNGRVKITPYWGGQIITGQDQVEELAAGAADIGYIFPLNAKTGFAICKVMNLFFDSASVETGERVMKELRAKFPEIDKEYTDAGLKVLEWNDVLVEVVARKPVRKLADLKGMRIKAGGGQNRLLKELGAEGVSASMADMYVSLQKGIVDGVVSPVEVIADLKFADVTKHVALFDFNSSTFAQRAMTLSKWKSLPPDIQKVFENNVEYWGQQVEAEIASANVHAIEYGKTRGVEFSPISKEDKAQLNRAMVSLAEKDAKELDTKGIRATQILQEVQRLIKQYGE